MIPEWPSGLWLLLRGKRFSPDKGVLEAADFWNRYADEEIKESLLGTASIPIATGRGMYFICPLQNYGSIVIELNPHEFSGMLPASPLNSGVELVIYDGTGEIWLKNDPE